MKHKLQCKGCGSDFEYHRKKAFCSVGCRPKPKRRKVEKKGRKSKCFICMNCASIFKKTNGSKRTGTFCSRKCCFDWKAKRKEIIAVQSEGDNWNSPSNKNVKCLSCSEWFTPAKQGQLYCSHDAWEKKDGVIHRRCANVKRECRKEGCTNTVPKWKTHCAHCQTKSDLAHKKAAKIKRKRKLLATQVEAIHPDEIFERDGWKCKECGVNVSKQYDVNDDRYPNLDHIIPVSKGGTHTKENVQCLCRKCNLEKSDVVVSLF